MRRATLLAATAFVVAACADVDDPTSLEPTATLQHTAGGTDVIVVLDPAHAAGSHRANADAARSIAADLGLAARHAYGTALFGFSATVPEGRLSALERDPRVAYVDRDAPVWIPPRMAAPPWADDGGDAAQQVPWGVERVGSQSNAATGAGIHVYVIDTGIDATHDDLAANLGNGFAAVNCRGGGCAADWDDDHGHGTHVAGTVGAIDNDIDVIGVAPEVTLHAVKVLSGSGSGTRSDVIAGVDWVASETAARGQPSVANMSLGGSGSKTGTCTDSGFVGSDSYHEAICNARHSGAVFAVAAGNDGADSEGAVPAAYDDAVVTVSATDSSDDWTSWSNWGDEAADWTANVSAPVGIAAPGASILSTEAGGGTSTKSGTSMASPHVAGGLALILQSGTYAADGNAFLNARSALLSNAESTSGWTNTSGNPHDEDFLDARNL